MQSAHPRRAVRPHAGQYCDHDGSLIVLRYQKQCDIDGGTHAPWTGGSSRKHEFVATLYLEVFSTWREVCHPTGCKVSPPCASRTVNALLRSNRSARERVNPRAYAEQSTIWRAVLQVDCS